jgi:hypothetical protein
VIRPIEARPASKDTLVSKNASGPVAVPFVPFLAGACMFYLLSMDRHYGIRSVRKTDYADEARDRGIKVSYKL